MSELNPRTDSGHGGRMTDKPEGCGRVVVAVVLSTMALYPAACFLGHLCFLASEAVASFVVFAGAGVTIALLVALLVPRRRWIVGVPLVVALQLGGASTIAVFLAAEDYYPPPGMFSGALTGIALGILLIALPSQHASTTAAHDSHPYSGSTVSAPGHFMHLGEVLSQSRRA